MKFDITEGKFGTSIDIIPETAAEMALLARVAVNSKAEKPAIRLYFENDKPSLAVFLRKISPNVQRSSIAAAGK